MKRKPNCDACSHEHIHTIKKTFAVRLIVTIIQLQKHLHDCKILKAIVLYDCVTANDMDDWEHHGFCSNETRAAKTHKPRAESPGRHTNNVCHNCPLSIPSSNERSQRNMGLPWVIYDAETQEPSLWNHLCLIGCSLDGLHLIWFQMVSTSKWPVQSMSSFAHVQSK